MKVYSVFKLSLITILLLSTFLSSSCSSTDFVRQSYCAPLVETLSKMVLYWCADQKEARHDSSISLTSTGHHTQEQLIRTVASLLSPTHKSIDISVHSELLCILSNEADERRFSQLLDERLYSEYILKQTMLVPLPTR